MKDLVTRLRLGASISRDRNLNLDYATVADDAADAIEALETKCAMQKGLIDGFLEVDKELKAELAALQWVDITDRLPKAYDEVMVWPHPSNNSMTADINSIGVWRSGEYESGFGWTESVCYPTHWMPLPNPPGAKP